MDHLVAMSGHGGRPDLQLLDGLPVRQATSGRVAVLQPHGIRAVLRLDLRVGLSVREGSIVSGARAIGNSLKKMINNFQHSETQSSCPHLC